MRVSAVGGAGSPYFSQTSAAGNQFSQFFNNLQKLQQQNPDQLKATLSNIADELTTAAQQTSGPQAQKLEDLANKYQQAAQTGDISQLRPAHHGGGHHHRAQGVQPASDASGTSATSSTTSSQQVNTQSLFEQIFQEVSKAANGS